VLLLIPRSFSECAAKGMRSGAVQHSKRELDHDLKGIPTFGKVGIPLRSMGKVAILLKRWQLAQSLLTAGGNFDIQLAPSLASSIEVGEAR
jgi:hypothetical protein